METTDHPMEIRLATEEDIPRMQEIFRQRNTEQS